LRIDEARLSAELGARVPKQLAEARGRDVGAPGKLSYTITRGGFRYNVGSGSLSIETDLSGKLEVCKPLGPVCLRYGDCRPAWNASVSLPLEWTEPLKATTQVQMTSGCVLKPVGYDATTQVEEVTAREAGKIDRRIDSELAEAQRGWLARLREGLHPVKILPEGDAEPLCLSVTTQALEYDVTPAPEGEPAGVSVAAQVQGDLNLSCEGPRPLPTPRWAPGLAPEIDVHIPLAVSFQELEAQLSRNAPAPVSLRSFRSFAPEGLNTLFVGLDGYDACGTLWLLVQPRLTPEGIQLITQATGRAAAWLNAQVVPSPRERAALEAALAKTQTRLETQLERLKTEQDVHVQLRTELQPEVHVDRNSLVLVLRLRGQAQAQAR
jgi:hypothetical protein